MRTHMLVIVSVAIFVAVLGTTFYLTPRHVRTQPMPAVIVVPDPITKQYIASLDVARVFGRSPGCSEADPKLINEIAEESIKAGLDPRILAATIATESSCNQFATSSRGAIGLTQVVPRVWKNTYNFETQYNLLNRHDNIHVGADILSGLIKQYGPSQGLRRYNGSGEGCPTCDEGYTDRITQLAGRRGTFYK